MKDKIFGVLQRVGRSFMLPIAILPVAGLFLGIGGSFTNANMIEAYGLTKILGEGTLLHALLVVLNKCGDIVFANLPLIFAMGVAIGMAKKEKDVAALSGAIAFLIMHSAIGALLDLTGKATTLPDGSVTSVLGIQSLQMGVFGGILVGLGVAALHNRFYKIELPQVLSFFGGTRFVPIISAIVYLFVGILMFFIWPVIQNGIFAIGDLVRSSGYAGTFLYGLMERALIPFGLHHVFYLPFWQTAVGGTAMVGGQLVEGAQNIFFAELANGNISHFSVEATRFMSGKFPLMIFGLPGAALAMYKCANPKKKKIVSSLLLSAALTSMITGITEPIEFTFLFVAPMLFVVHAFLAATLATTMWLAGIVGINSGGLIEIASLNLIPLMRNHWQQYLLELVIGLIFTAIWFVVFRFLILKFDFKTPGREDEAEIEFGSKEKFRNKQAEKGGKAGDPKLELCELILEGLGGKDNIVDVTNCATRLRVNVKDETLCKDDPYFKAIGTHGCSINGKAYQVIIGLKVPSIREVFETLL